jgi:Gpi18-like mannosyltransferase
MKKIIIFAFLLRLLFIFGDFHPDLFNHVVWGKKIWEYGFNNFYNVKEWSVCPPNQPPGTIYLWAGISKINDFINKNAWNLNLKYSFFPSFIIPFLQNSLHKGLLKLPSVFCDLGIGYLIYKLLLNKGKKTANLGLVLWLFNPIVIYNSSIWGQTDSIINFFFLFSLFLLFNKKYFISVLILLLSFYFKISLVIFAPLYLIILIKEKISLIKILSYIIFSSLFFVLLSLPFSSGNPIVWLINTIIFKVINNQGSMLTGNAYNIWSFFFGIDITRPSNGSFLGISFVSWGVTLMLVFYGIIFELYSKKNNKPWNIFFSFLLISFFSYLFMTNMHERYLYPIFPYLTLLTAIKIIPKKIFILISLIHFINLYNLWYVPEIKFLRLGLINYQIFFDKFFPVLLMIIFVFLLNRYSKLVNDKIKLNEK